MSDLFDDGEDEKTLIVDDEVEDVEEVVEDNRSKPVNSDARRRLEALMEEKRLQSELDDYLDE
jgi:hypothetical protein